MGVDVTLGSLNFKLKPATKKREPSSGVKKVTKLVKGLVVYDKDTFKVKIEITTDEFPDLMFLEFTPDSYNLKGVIKVWDKEEAIKGKSLQYVRNANQCRFFPGSQDKLIPFCTNWIVSGHVVRIDGKLMFSLSECIAPDDYLVDVPHEDEETNEES